MTVSRSAGVTGRLLRCRRYASGWPSAEWRRRSIGARTRCATPLLRRRQAASQSPFRAASAAAAAAAVIRCRAHCATVETKRAETRPRCPKSFDIKTSVPPGLDWPLCHCAVAQAPPVDEHRRPLAPSKFQNGASKLLLMAQPLKHPQSESAYHNTMRSFIMSPPLG